MLQQCWYGGKKDWGTNATIDVMAILTVDHLSKNFKKFQAVEDISFELKEGEILGLLGPNGAGKTTTIQMLLGILTPSSGTIKYFGKDLLKHREEILEEVNFSSTYTNLPWDLTVRENFVYTVYFYQIDDRKKRIREVVELFNLDKIYNKKIRELSSGQITQVNLAKAFLNKPRVLLLDEPTASLDPETARLVRDLLLEKQKELNISVILTSHNMSEVESICNRVIFINEGKIFADDTPQNLAKTITTSHIELRFDEKMDQVIEFCQSKQLKYKKNNKYLTVDIKEKEIPEFLSSLIKNKFVYSEISIEKPSLEDFFLENITVKRME